MPRCAPVLFQLESFVLSRVLHCCCACFSVQVIRRWMRCSSQTRKTSETKTEKCKKNEWFDNRRKVTKKTRCRKKKMEKKRKRKISCSSSNLTVWIEWVYRGSYQWLYVGRNRGEVRDRLFILNLSFFACLLFLFLLLVGVSRSFRTLLQLISSLACFRSDETVFGADKIQIAMFWYAFGCLFERNWKSGTKKKQEIKIAKKKNRNKTTN